MKKLFTAAFLGSLLITASIAQVPPVNSGTAVYPSSGTLQVYGAAMKLLPSIVGSLPTCNAGAQGVMYLATDLLTPTALGIAIGGGAVIAPVVCNGTNWVTVL